MAIRWSSKRTRRLTTSPSKSPNLPGLDAIEIASASFSIASAPYQRTQAVPANAPSGGAVGITLGGVAPGQTVTLTGVVLSGLAATPPSGVSYALWGTQGTVYWTEGDDGDIVSTTTNPGGTVQHLHILIRPGTGGNAGPPIAAAPHFNMPGAGAGLYGPALGGASLSVVRRSNGLVDATLTMAPAQPMSACTVLIGTAAEGSSAIGAHGGLPTDVADVPWSAASAEGLFDTRAQAITVATHAGATPPEDGALITRFDTDPGGTLRSVDFAPAARAAMDQGYPTATGPDLGLTLRVQVDTPGALYLQLGSVAARYVQRPLPLPATLALRGAPESVVIPVPEGLRPQGISFRVDGRYGPARLIGDVDTAPEGSRHGYRIAGAQRAARRLLLSAKEATLPLVRLALYGRASEDGEILITRHGGDESRIGAALGPPVSRTVNASDTPTWHRVEIPVRDGLPPHAGAFWITVQATKGVFWWHSDMEATVPASQVSADEGVSWTAASGRPLAQAWVEEVDPATGDPAPLAPLSLSWANGILNADIVGVNGAAMAPDFTRLWIAEGAGNDALLDGIAELPGQLALHLHATRDVDLSLADVALTYDPWNAGTAA